MEYLITPLIIIVIGTAITVSFVLIMKSKKKNPNNSLVMKQDLTTQNSAIIAANNSSGITIPIDLLPATVEVNDNALSEITNKTVVARISQTFPAIAETASRTVANNALKNMEVYRAILPSGETLAKSKDFAGAMRGFSLGDKGISHHAEFMKVDVSKSTALASGVANVMNVGSLVVGQYYMSEITSKLETMTKSIDKISDFQDREFKSRILSAITLVSEISQFSSEIMENDEQVKLKLASLDNLKSAVTELLGQVNITISEITNNNQSPSFKEYQKDVAEFRLLSEYQNALVSVLDEISKMTYLLGKGSVSIEMSRVTYNKYFELSVQTINKLEQWHNTQVAALRIDLDKHRKTKTGLEGFFSAIPGFVDDKFKYIELEQGMVETISTQSQSGLQTTKEPQAVYAEDVQIIIKGGKYYYLHEPTDVK